MKNLLIIAYYFPPCTHVGAFRPASVAKYAARQGWNVTVLAATFEGSFDNGGEYRIERVEAFDVLSRLKSDTDTNASPTTASPVRTSAVANGLIPSRAGLKRLAKSVVAFPDRHNGWMFEALRCGRRIIQRENIDAILSTSSPQTSALVARKLAGEFNLPWVADFRDLWTQYQRYVYGGFRRHVEQRLERWTLARADALTTVTEPLAGKWRELHPRHTIRVIPNSFDPELYPDRGIAQQDVLTITLTGKTIQGSQDPSILFQAVGELLDEHQDWRERIRIRFFGYQFEWMKPLIERFGVSDVVELNSPVSRAEALQHQVDSSLLLVLTWTNPAETGVLTGKLPEYLGAGRPVLAVGPYHDAVTEVLHATGAGLHFTRVEPLKEYLRACSAKLQQGGTIDYNIDTAEVAKYSAPAMASSFIEAIERAAEHRAGVADG